MAVEVLVLALLLLFMKISNQTLSKKDLQIIFISLSGQKICTIKLILSSPTGEHNNLNLFRCSRINYG